MEKFRDKRSIFYRKHKHVSIESMAENDPKCRQAAKTIQTVDGIRRIIFADVKKLFAVCVSWERNQQLVRLDFVCSYKNVVKCACKDQQTKEREQAAEK